METKWSGLRFVPLDFDLNIHFGHEKLLGLLRNGPQHPTFAFARGNWKFASVLDNTPYKMEPGDNSEDNAWFCKNKQIKQTKQNKQKRSVQKFSWLSRSYKHRLGICSLGKCQKTIPGLFRISKAHTNSVFKEKLIKITTPARYRSNMIKSLESSVLWHTFHVQTERQGDRESFHQQTRDLRGKRKRSS